MPRKVFDYGRGVYCEELGGEFYVYGVMLGGDAYVCPSEAMARDVAASAL